jgi:D-cysteine desulfhydrase
LWAKRDDLMGVGGGGNKLRKLELLIGEALAQGCDTFITTGGLQSNHARQSAAAAARAGLACELMLADMVTYQEAAYTTNGNLLLDDLFGATVHRLKRGADPLKAARQRAAEIADQGGKAYVVGAGGSSPLGCLGYVAAAAEILEQERAMSVRFGSIVVPNGSCGTHAGLVAGLRAAQDDPRRILSFTVLAPLEEAISQTKLLARQTLDLVSSGLELPDVAVAVDGTQRGESYGAPTEAMLAALRLMARTEGLLLDPVYSGKAFAGVLDFARREVWRDQDVLFIMTGGTPGLYAYREAISGG